MGFLKMLSWLLTRKRHFIPLKNYSKIILPQELRQDIWHI